MTRHVSISNTLIPVVAILLTGMIASGAVGQAGDDALLTEDAPGDDALLTEDAPADDALLTEDAPGDDALLAEDAPADDALLTEDNADPLLTGDTPTATSTKKPSEMAREIIEQNAASAHAALFAEDQFPSATTCKTCHPKHYKEWAVSQHAYSQLSPVFNAMHGTVVKLTNGTNGDFCVRCHNQIGMIRKEPVFMSNLDRHPASREGITCIVCHRMNQAYGKVSGRFDVVQGDLLQPVYGPSGSKELDRVLSEPGKYRVVTEADASGRKIHTKAERFFLINKSGFCATCHDVTLVNGFRLEEAFSEYKTSPAAQRGESCQDCHMGKVQGIASGYDHGPAAVVGGVPTKDRKLTNHFFAGPDHSVVHPGIFPHNTKAQELATLREWLQFDYKAGWGTNEFEDKVKDDHGFPKRWASVDDRFDARDIINENLEALDWAKNLRLEVMRNGFVLGDIVTERADEREIRFKVQIRNGIDGHNVPTGFTGERLIWLQINVTDRDGKIVMKTGDLDPNGDVRDLHSLYVHDGKLPLDDQLFSLQSKFLTRNVRGGEREQVLAVNYSVDPLPFLRPDTTPTVLYGRILGARIHKTAIPPAGSRWPVFKVSGRNLTGRGPYTANVKLNAAMVPVNLINAIKGVGFDYSMSPREIADRIVEGHLTLWERNIKFHVHD